MTLQEISYYWGIIPILFGLFFFIQLTFSDVGKNKSNRLLARYFLFLTIMLICKYTNDLDTDWIFPLLMFSPLLTFLSPLLYRYVYFLAQENIQQETKLNHWLHFGVPGLFLLVNFSFYSYYGLFGEGGGFYEAFLILWDWTNSVGFQYFASAQVVFYSFWTIKYLHRYRSSIGEFSSFKEGLELKWLNTFTLSFIVAAIIFTFSKFIPGSVSLFYPAILIHILYSGLFVIKRNFTLYKVSLEAEFRSKEIKIETSEKTNNQTEPKYKGSALKDEQRIDTIKESVLDLMSNHKVYLDPTLTVFKVGKELKLNSKYVSQVINQEFNKNFISFVNSFRVDEVKRLMKEDMYENLTLEGLALKAGFKSKSSFNIAFKKEVGMTPSQYRKEILD